MSLLEQLKKIRDEVVTAAVLRADGFTLIPIDTGNNIDVGVLADFLGAGCPGQAGDIYAGRLLVTPEQWEARKHQRVERYDPLTRELQEPDDVRDWQALPPIKIGEGAVPFELVVSFGAARGLLPRDVTRSQYLDYPAGTAPIDAPRSLRRAVELWPFTLDAERIAKAWIETAPPTVSFSAPPPRYEPPAVTRPNSGQTRESWLANLFVTLFTTSEMDRFLFDRQFPLSELPGTAVPHADRAFAAASLLSGHGFVDENFFNALVSERPRQAERIEVVRAFWRSSRS